MNVFLIPFFVVSSVLFVADLQRWILLVGAGMLASMVRCRLSWKSAEGVVLEKLKRTFYGALGMFVVMIAAGLAAFWNVSGLILAILLFVLVASFVLYSVKRP